LSTRILSVSYFEDSYQYLEIDKQSGGYFPRPAQQAGTVEALLSACRQADEIYINATMPSALYEWENFPKVAKKYVANVVMQDAREKVGEGATLQVQYKVLGEVVEAGVAKSRIAYIAVQPEDLTPLWTTFGKFGKKLKAISPISVALASMVAKIDRPSENFTIVWIGPNSSMIIISSPEGVVKVARTVPLGMPREEEVSDPEALRVFSEDFGREFFMTSTFFKQEFREGVPNLLYFLGHTRLADIFGEHPLAGAPADVRFSLAESPAKGLSESQGSELAHLIANIYLPDEFSFLPEEAAPARTGDIAYRVALAAMVLIIIGVGFWTFRLNGVKQDGLAQYDKQVAAIEKLQKEVMTFRDDVDRLQPLVGWKKFYEETFQNRPAWNMVFSELGLLLPENIIIDEFRVTPRRGATGGKVLSEMSGSIKADNWEAGLEVLRDFGTKLQSSPVFEVVDVSYAPEDVQKITKVFNFKIRLNLMKRGFAHAS